MSKFQKLFGLSLLMFAVSFFAVACETTEEEPKEQESYSAKIVGGYMFWHDEELDTTWVWTDGQSGLFYEDDILVFVSADPLPGQVFYRWNVSPSTYNNKFYEDDRYNPDDAAFFMPAADVVITAEYNYDGVASVRFVWERDWQSEIDYIYASASNIQWWKENIWEDLEDTLTQFDFLSSWDETMTGIAGLPAIFEFPGEDDDGEPLPFDDSNHAVEFPAPAGSYMAVCSVYDETLDIMWEIIADYDITINKATATKDGDDSFFELGFDLTNFFAEDPIDVNPETGLGMGWYYESYKDGDLPGLEKGRRKASVRKTATKTIVKSGATMEVTYYAFPRAKSKARS